MTDPGDARDLEGGGLDELGDDALADRQDRSAHVVTSSVAGATSASRSLSAASASAMRSGTRARGGPGRHVAGVADHPPLALPWVMMTVPLTPSNGEPPWVS